MQFCFMNASHFWYKLKLKSAFFLDLEVPLSAAQIQGYFMFHKEDPVSAVKNLHLFKPVGNIMS